MFRDAAIYEHSVELEEYTTSKTSYISKCIKIIMIVSYANQRDGC